MTVLTSAPAWSGSLPTWLLLAMAVAVAWRLSRGGGGTAVVELSKANEVLTSSLAQARKLIGELQDRIAVLENRTDIVAAVTPILAEHEKRARERHDAAEKRAQERHDATVHVLEALVSKASGEEVKP